MHDPSRRRTKEPQHRDIVFNVTEKAVASNKQHKRHHQHHHHRHAQHTDHQHHKMRENRISSPRFLTINVPIVPPEKQRREAWPPQEIIIEGNSGRETKPPQTIQVKELFSPPKEIVVVEPKQDTGRVPDVINISDVIAAKQRVDARHIGYNMEVAAQKEKNHAIVKAQQKRKEQQLVEAFDKVKNRVVATTNHPPLERKKNDPEKLRKELPALGDELTAIKQSDSILTPQVCCRQTRPIIITTTKLQKESCPDPPAAKAPTTHRQILPDFSNLSSNKRRATTGRRKNILDESNGNNQFLHQSWPVPQKLDASMHAKARRSRPPQWLGVTGTAEDWINGADQDIRQIGRKIASQRLEI